MALGGDRGEHGAGMVLGDDDPVQFVEDVITADHVMTGQVGEAGRARLTGTAGLTGGGVVDVVSTLLRPATPGHRRPGPVAVS